MTDPCVIMALSLQLPERGNPFPRRQITWKPVICFEHSPSQCHLMFQITHIVLTSGITDPIDELSHLVAFKHVQIDIAEIDIAKQATGHTNSIGGMKCQELKR